MNRKQAKARLKGLNHERKPYMEIVVAWFLVRLAEMEALQLEERNRRAELNRLENERVEALLAAEKAAAEERRPKMIEYDTPKGIQDAW